MKYLYSFLIIFSACSVFGQTKNVLFLGNSYTAVNNLPLMVRDLALSLGDTINFESNTPGGYTLQGHSTNATSLANIEHNEWDYVILQEQSQLPSFPPSQVATDVYPYAQILVDSIKSSSPCAEPFFYMTWGRKNGDSQNCPFYTPLCTYEGMQARLRESYLEMASNNNCSVSPVGATWKYVRDNYSTIELYSADESHPSINGSYLAACVHYASMFRKSPVGASYTSSLSSSDAALLQSAAELVVLDSLSTWRIGSNDVIADFTEIINGNSVTFTETGINGNTYSWNLGDGFSETSPSFTHVYASEGTYNVELISSNQCDSDTISYQIMVGGTEIIENEIFSSFIKTPNQITIRFNSSSNKHIFIYDSKGSLAGSYNEYSSSFELPFNSKGIFIIYIIDGVHQSAIKFFNE